MWRSAGAFVVVAAFGCTKSNPAASCKAGTCVDPAYPYCDAEGVIADEPGSCVAVACTPGGVIACIGDDALQCTSDGMAYQHVSCDLGCLEVPTPHCAYIEPRYLPDICDTVAADDSFNVASSAMLDANLDSNCTGGIVAQTGAPAVCVLHYRTITIQSGATLQLGDTPSVTPGRVVAFVADEELVVDGTLDISAHGRISGPGGGAVQSGGLPQVNGVNNGPAGGGAGGRTAGAPGGNQNQDGGANNGGPAAADPAFLAALVGGASAFQLDGSDMTAYEGGGGGGAATLISCRGSISVTGTINAGGGGGPGGALFLFNSSLPGGGGGAGGYVVLQGSEVQVTGRLFANGGGGGGGMQSNNASGVPGDDGTQSATLAAAGGSMQNGEGFGGKGGAATMQPTFGGKPTTGPAAAGGGGGSVGFFQTYTPANKTPALMPSAISPAFQPNGVIRTR